MSLQSRNRERAKEQLLGREKPVTGRSSRTTKEVKDYSRAAFDYTAFAKQAHASKAKSAKKAGGFGNGVTRTVNALKRLLQNANKETSK